MVAKQRRCSVAMVPVRNRGAGEGGGAKSNGGSDVGGSAWYSSGADALFAPYAATQVVECDVEAARRPTVWSKGGWGWERLTMVMIKETRAYGDEENVWRMAWRNLRGEQGT